MTSTFVEPTTCSCNMVIAASPGQAYFAQMNNFVQFQKGVLICKHAGSHSHSFAAWAHVFKPELCSLRSADVLLGVGQMSLPRAEARPLTEAHSPDLATKHRAAHQHPRPPEQSQADQGFKAQPLNKKILEGPVWPT